MNETTKMMTAERFLRMIPVGDLFQSATNPRKRFDEAAMLELMASIKELGIRQALIVREIPAEPGRFEIVAGERRWRAAGRLGLRFLSAEVVAMTDEEVLSFQLVENVQREGLTPLEELSGCRDLIGLGMDRERVAELVGKSPGWVQARLDLGDLPGPVLEAMDSGKLGMASAGEILKVEEADREEFTQELLSMGEVPTAGQLARIVSERYVVPRENRERWKEFCEARVWGAVVPVEDPERWADYVRPYGDGVGKWKPSTDKIAGLAARAAESGVTWGELAAAHGIAGLAVPLGGVRAGEIRVVELVDRALIEAAERGARSTGGNFTLGPRAAKVVAEVGAEVEVEEEVDFKEVAESYVVAALPKLSRDAAWSPWVVDEIGVDAEHLIRGVLARAVLDQEMVGWAARFEEVVGSPVSEFLRPEVFWLLRDGSLDDKRSRTFAGLFGIMEEWAGRMGAK